jgi:hypothetical protein
MLYDKRWDKPQAVDAIGKIILAAADRLDRDGWCQAAYHDKQGRHCIVGAFARGDTENIAVGDTSVALRRVGVHLGMMISHWNDHQCKSGEEASAMLRKAALEK